MKVSGQKFARLDGLFANCSLSQLLQVKITEEMEKSFSRPKFHSFDRIEILLI